MSPPIGMAVRLFSLAFVIGLLAACQSSSSTKFPDAAPLPDAAVGVMCASSVCSTSLGCCAVTGGTPSCLASGQSCSGKLMMCDGPEDCGSGMSCCVLSAGGTSCETATMCQSNGFIACNGDGDCPGELPSCCNHACSSECSFW